MKSANSVNNPEPLTTILLTFHYSVVWKCFKANKFPSIYFISFMYIFMGSETCTNRWSFVLNCLPLSSL